MVTVRTIVLLCVLLVPACSATTSEPPAGEPVLVSADSAGAVLMDDKSGSYRGVDRTGREIWSNTEAYAAGAEARCLKQCPDVVLSRFPLVRQIIEGTASAFTADGRALGVLAARSPADVVAVAENSAGGAELHVRRTNGERLSRPVPTNEMAWAENPSRTAAVALPRNPDAGGKVHAFRRDAHGWRLVDDRLSSDGVWDACVAGDGELAVVTGPGAFMITDLRHRRELHTDLGEVAECVLGRQGGAVVRRTMSGDGAKRTEIRGIGTDGRQTWSRDLRAEAQLSAHPDGHVIALVHSGKLELVDSTGRTVSTQDGVASARFTADGELVTVESGRVRWHRPSP